MGNKTKIFENKFCIIRTINHPEWSFVREDKITGRLNYQNEYFDRKGILRTK